jgi:branched-chain amino acid transport system substrate-binding protein
MARPRRSWYTPTPMSSRIPAAACCTLACLLSACVSPRALRETSPVRIGIYADLSSTAAHQGTDALHGAELRIVQTNSAGGLGGREVQLVSVDMKQSATEAVKAYTRLAQEEGVCAVIGAGAPGSGLAVSPVADLSRVPLVSLEIDDRVTTPDMKTDDPARAGATRRYSFLVQASAAQAAASLAGFAAMRFPAYRYATLCDPVSPLSVIQARAFESVIRASRRQAAVSIAMTEGDQEPAVQALRRSGAEAVYVCAAAEKDAEAAKAIRAALPGVLLLGNQAWGESLPSLAGDAASGAWFAAPYAGDDPALAEIAPAFTERYGDTLRPAAAAGWDAVGLILAAVRKAGTSDPVRVRDALEQTGKLKVLQGTLDMDRKTHRPAFPPVAIMRIEGREYRTENPRFVYRPSAAP